MQEELIQQFKDGNKQAGDDFYNLNIGLVYKASRCISSRAWMRKKPWH